MKMPSPILFLSQLSTSCPALTPAAGLSIAEAASVCLAEQGHPRIFDLMVNSEKEQTYQVERLEVTPQMRRCYNDDAEATEFGACAIAILAVQEMTNLAVIERSRKSTGFDYWLGTSEPLPFQRKARLEVSGIRMGNKSMIEVRIGQKVRQVERYPNALPIYIVVVEFSQPIAQVRVL